MKRSTYRNLLAGLSLFTSVAAHTATITVTGTGDTIAIDGFVTLREALTAANTDAISGDAPAGSVGLDTINFNIAGLPGTVHTIQPTVALPTITSAIVIDGYSQPGASMNTLATGNNAFLAIEIDGTNAGLNAGLIISAGNSTVQGLVINRFANEGILIITSGNNTIRGNFLGTDQTGTLDRGNGVSGVSLLSPNNTVGGTLPAHRNLISGNDFSGVGIAGVGADNNRIINNYIGTNDAGTAALANNVGVRILDGVNNIVGGILTGTGNIIAFNTAEGVLLSSTAGVGNAILGNSIHSNGTLGIDLNANGSSANDLLDADVGPNNLQNFAVLTSALSNEEGLRLAGTLESTANTAFRIEFFSNAVGDLSTFGEGEVYLGFVDVTTDGNGNVAFNFTTSASQSIGAQISATVTDANNNTSEFSANISVVYQPASENDGDDDDDELIPFIGPSPFFPPFGPPFPTPLAPGVPVPVDAAVAAADATTEAVAEAVDESNETAITVAPMTEIDREKIAARKDKVNNDEKAAGCSTFGETPPSMIVLLGVIMLFLKHRRRKPRT